ncbi:hypothetical protein H6F88_23500 [Oculatella sp. FACHB-28]|uniref:hypothetical protein n=1 Tax=Cyanophyceae TaxID=3028117 RepID=UPI001688F270|nr:MULTISPECIES: hypothetical protein [Cyanophyceae]MBD1999794.1 hypothetical protein [Leptolyngbya sp. FACHB-541]MBD2058925.1 hypothetical protein [Oculatella sp. FACHB-28]
MLSGHLPLLNKSSRHSKIAGEFFEHLVLYWLSKYGLECARIDHVGIDLLAKHPDREERLGISVKGRTRNIGKETEHLNIPNDNFDKAEAACKAFGCTPYFAIVIDSGQNISAFILPMAELLRLFPRGERVSVWKMTPRYLAQYSQNPKIVQFSFSHNIHQWFDHQISSENIGEPYI